MIVITKCTPQSIRKSGGQITKETLKKTLSAEHLQKTQGRVDAVSNRESRVQAAATEVPEDQVGPYQRMDHCRGYFNFKDSKVEYSRNYLFVCVPNCEYL